MAAENLDWAVFALGVTGAAIDEVHPQELLNHLHAWGDRFAAAEPVNGGRQSALAPPSRRSTGA